MRKQQKTTRAACVAFAAMALALLGFAGSASAKLTGEFVRFQHCPYTNAEVNKCIFATTEGGEVALGSKTVPIEKPVIVQGGYSKPVERFSKFFAATNGVTLAPIAQNVPGGLVGLVPPEGSPLLVKELIKLTLENGFTGVGATLELARPASEIVISEPNLTFAEGLALKLPVKIHLENPALGGSCYVGSSSAPIYWELTTGVTSPPEPNKPITGNTGEVEFINEGEIVGLFGDVLVDNAWAAPAANGCGGALSFLINPIVNLSAGLPSAAGKNSAILENTAYTTSTFALKVNDEENP
jgi:hypothetical protein